MNTTRDEIPRLAEKYADLVWYARSGTLLHTHPKDVWIKVMQSRARIEAKYPLETKAYNDDDSPNWVHGFNSGCLAAFRYMMTESADDAERNFPDLDS